AFSFKPPSCLIFLPAIFLPAPRSGGAATFRPLPPLPPFTRFPGLPARRFPCFAPPAGAEVNCRHGSRGRRGMPAREGEIMRNAWIACLGWSLPGLGAAASASDFAAARPAPADPPATLGRPVPAARPEFRDAGVTPAGLSLLDRPRPAALVRQEGQPEPT